MRVLVCGSRYLKRHHGSAIYLRLRKFGIGSHTLIHGNADGADTLAAYAASALCWDIESYPADWKKHGRGAGLIRNQQMLDEGRPEMVVAFHTNPTLGRGTADMVRRAREEGVPVEVHILPMAEAA